MYILDSSAFIRGHTKGGNITTVAEVSEELNGEARLRFEAMRGGGMEIQVPQERTIEEVIRISKKTGDHTVLSRTDICLIAAAMELEGVLVTDDYAIQNTAAEIGLMVEGIAMETIKDKRNWIFKCGSCGKESRTMQKDCPICGGQLNRKNPSK